MNFGRQFPITTSTPVIISIILNGFQLDARSLMQAERNEKALKRIQKKMMHGTLDWSQSNNISCVIICVLGWFEFMLVYRVVVFVRTSSNLHQV